jgi:hypothetical protein
MGGDDFQVIFFGEIMEELQNLSAVQIKGQYAAKFQEIDHARDPFPLCGDKIQKEAIDLEMTVSRIPKIDDKYVGINKEGHLFLVQFIASRKFLNFGLVFLRVVSISFHASSGKRMETFSSRAEVTGDIKEKGRPLKVTTTFSPLETVRIASPVWFLRSLAVIVRIGSPLNSYLISIIAIWKIKGNLSIFSAKKRWAERSCPRSSKNGRRIKRGQGVGGSWSLENMRRADSSQNIGFSFDLKRKAIILRDPAFPGLRVSFCLFDARGRMMGIV